MGYLSRFNGKKPTVFFETPINSFIYVCFMIPKPDPEPTNVLLR